MARASGYPFEGSAAGPVGSRKAISKGRTAASAHQLTPPPRTPSTTASSPSESEILPVAHVPTVRSELAPPAGATGNRTRHDGRRSVVFRSLAVTRHGGESLMR